ncbi:lipid-A-disaccharide synthase [Flavobacterium aurantiibacter]|uniref:Lipid-A-disaccharide synthase n=1 Tax=Flavobacterium aurantiibacter TaxID=2023067 RepID=A0A255ZLM5_9FLAO|nr:lipid-A-disaccharide synthase [Flavobacterium aurantiibacter]OYQ42309.1 lipid-A-disaccharide synthase [Flavobacterium aurantiibacter]
MKYYIIAGEASGDLHGSNLIKELVQLDVQAEIRAWGGELMEGAGAKVVKNYRDLAFMGFAEVVKNLGTILKNIAFCKNDIAAFKPDVLILIDYPGFNMRIAKWAKQHGIRVHYYISPQIWAWKENRIKAIKRDVDRMFVILPFEKSFYEDKHHFKVDYVGHPLLDAMAQRSYDDFDTFCAKHQLNNKPKIVFLPGSRKQEIEKMLAQMLKMVAYYPQYEFVIAGAPGQEAAFYKKFISNYQVKLLFGVTYDLLHHATAALVTSGTATLETALFKVPEVVCYRGSFISYQIAKRILTLKYISLVNLIMDQEIVTELIQDRFNEKNLKSELDRCLASEHRAKMLYDYEALIAKLGSFGASRRTAELILADLQVVN